VVTTNGPKCRSVRCADRGDWPAPNPRHPTIQLVLFSTGVRPKMNVNQAAGGSDVTDILALPLVGSVLEDNR